MSRRFKGIPSSLESEAYSKVLSFFFAHPTEKFSLNDVAEILSIHKQTANKIITQLASERFLDIETIGRLWRISCNQEHLFNLTRKVPYHLQLIYESGILEAIKKQIPQAKCIILFGSYRKGDDIAQSDVDIAVEVLDDEDVQVVQFGTLARLGYRKNIPVNLHIYSRNHVNLNLFNNIANGIVLDGFLEVRP